MNIKIVVLVSAVVAVITTVLLWPLLVQAAYRENMISSTTVAGTQAAHLVPTIATSTATSTPQKLSPAQIIWLAKLMLCESGLKVTAINPNDLDNTPSYGLLQFKPSTYAAAAKKYGLASTTDYMNPEGQVAIVEQWILDGSPNWAKQFPACVRKLGTPPVK